MLSVQRPARHLAPLCRVLLLAPNTVSLTWDMALLLSNAAYERKAVHREQPARKHLRPVLIPTYLHLFTK